MSASPPCLPTPHALRLHVAASPPRSIDRSIDLGGAAVASSPRPIASRPICDGALVDPLDLWRQDRVSRSDLARLGRALADVHLMHAPSFRDAVAGDGAAACALAMHVARAPTSLPLPLRLALSALVVCAADGDLAAHEVLLHLRERLGRAL